MKSDELYLNTLEYSPAYKINCNTNKRKQTVYCNIQCDKVKICLN